AMEKSGSERISFGKIPFLWKKKINNFLKESRDKAIATFFENYRLNNEPKQMIYGLELSLPQSMNYIISFLDSLNLNEFTRILNLFNSSTFLENILKLDKEHQEKLLKRIADFWPNLNPKTIENIVSQVDPSLSLTIYQIITPESNELVNLLSLWIDQDVRVLYLLLDYYFKAPTNLVIPIFHQTPADRLITACKSKNLPVTIPESKIELFLKLFKASSEEIAYLFTGFSSCSKKSRSIFISWLTQQSLSIANTMSSIPVKQTSKEKLLIISYLKNLITHNKDIEIEILKELVYVPFDEIASMFLQELHDQGRKNGLDYLFDLVNILDEELSASQNFFNQEFQNYITQDRERVITTYFTTNNLVLHQILIQAIKSEKPQHWKQLVDLMVKHEYYKKKEQLLPLFSGFEERTKYKISDYIIKKSFILLFFDLFQDSDFLKPILTTTNPIEPNIHILLRNYLQKYIRENFDEITSLGKKITYPKDEIANILTKSELKKLVLHIGFSKNLLQPWEAVFLSRNEESLPHLLSQLELKTKKRKEPVIGLIKKILDIEYINFWKYIGKISAKRLPHYDPVCSYAFEKSIRNLGDIIVTLPMENVSYIAKKLVPKFPSDGRRMIYSILSTYDPYLLDNPKTYELLTAIIKLDPEEFVYITLLRLSKMIDIPNLNSFTKKLFKITLTSYTYQVFSEVDSHSLNQ
ncbi:MAG: hypothetical protein KAT16_09055, partial [Candidatus Heimdallarchaeota archaeon]|nr:hypothetical protein [Candidatus Heimdallarchaeota archaeon]